MTFNNPLKSTWVPIGMLRKHIIAKKQTLYIILEVLLCTMLNYSIFYYELLVLLNFVLQGLSYHISPLQENCQDIQTLRSQLRSNCVIYPLGKSVFLQYACIYKYYNLMVTIISRHRVIRWFNFQQIIPTIDPCLNMQLVYDLYLKSIEGPWLVDRL